MSEEGRLIYSDRTEEGHVRLSLAFVQAANQDAGSRVIALDILKDWRAELDNIYDALLARDPDWHLKGDPTRPSMRPAKE